MIGVAKAIASVMVASTAVTATQAILYMRGHLTSLQSYILPVTTTPPAPLSPVQSNLSLSDILQEFFEWYIVNVDSRDPKGIIILYNRLIKED